MVLMAVAMAVLVAVGMGVVTVSMVWNVTIHEHATSLCAGSAALAIGQKPLCLCCLGPSVDVQWSPADSAQATHATSTNGARL